MSEDQAQLQADLERLQERFPSLRPLPARPPTLRPHPQGEPLKPGATYLCHGAPGTMNALHWRTGRAGRNNSGERGLFFGSYHPEPHDDGRFDAMFEIVEEQP